MSKYYAVKAGRKTGIFTSWDECKQQVDGFSGASYKSFTSYEDALKYMGTNDNIIGKSSAHEKITNIKTVEAYIDGSYDKDYDLYSFGCVLIYESNLNRLSGIGTDKSKSVLRNVAGELLAAMKAIKWAYERKFKKIVIYYDYEGIHKWANGEWKANKEGTKDYVDFLENYKSEIVIDFIKVKAHTGNKYNEEADKLAKEAIKSWKNNPKLGESISREMLRTDKDLFEKYITHTSRKKNAVTFFIQGYELSEEKLIKIGKEIWKNKGNKVKNMESIQAKVDTDEFSIEWKITNKKNEQYIFKMYID